MHQRPLSDQTLLELTWGAYSVPPDNLDVQVLS